MPGDDDRACMVGLGMGQDFLQCVPVPTRPTGQRKGIGELVDDLGLRHRAVEGCEPRAVLVGGGGEERPIERLVDRDQATLPFGREQRVELRDQRSIHANES